MYKRLHTSRTKEDLMENILLPDANFEKIGRNGGSNKRYWDLAYFLMTHSTVLQVVHANKVLNKEHTWPGTVKWTRVKSLMQEVNRRLRSGKWMEIEVRRV